MSVEPDKHSFGPDWLEDAEDVLEETEFDSELGVELARDAQKLAEGEITEDEFFDRHHDDVQEEFGIDGRPTDPTHVEPLPEEVVKGAVEGNQKVADEDVPDATETWGQSAVTGGPGGDGGDGDGGQGDDDGTDRRTFLKSAGALAAGLTAATWSHRNPSGVWDDEEAEEMAMEGGGHDDEGKQLGMVIDTEACVGDLVCVDACKRENKSPQGAFWQFVFQYKESDDRMGGESPDYLVRPCQHCSNPPCVSVCPVRARHKREDDGIVLTDYDICIGCRYCQVACPYGVNHFMWGSPDDIINNQEGISTEEFRAKDADGGIQRDDKRGRAVAGPPPQKGVMTKCTFCVHRQDSDDIDNDVDPALAGTTACEQSCPQEAIQFGDLNDPESKPRQYLQERIDEDDQPSRYEEEPGQSERLSTFKFLEEKGTSPNVIYIGDGPGEHTEWASHESLHDDAPHAQTYEDIGSSKSRPGPGFSRTVGDH